MNKQIKLCIRKQHLKRVVYLEGRLVHTYFKAKLFQNVVLKVIKLYYNI